MLGAKLFGELEFWFSIIKIITIIAMIIVGLVMIFFSFKTSYGHASFSNLVNHGGIFPNGPAGFLMSFQIAVYSFIGIELIGVTAGETKDPRTVIPKAINNVPVRILLFYVGGLLVIMSVIPWNKINPDASPFVMLFSMIGLPFAAGLVNFVVLTAAASATNSGIYSNSRILFGLSKQGLGPKMCKTNHHSVPYLSMLVSSGTLLSRIIKFYLSRCNSIIYLCHYTLNCIIYSCLGNDYYFLHYICTKNPEEHKHNKFKLLGGKALAYVKISTLYLFSYFLILIVLLLTALLILLP